MAMYGKGGRRLLYDNQQEYYRIQEARSGSLRPFSSTSKPQIAHDLNRFVKYVKHDSLILDAGCRDGWAIGFLGKLGFRNVSGFDLIDKNVKFCKSQSYDVLKADAEDLSVYDDESFDAVFCRHTLEHVINPERAIFEFGRILKAAGILYCVVPLQNPRKPPKAKYGHSYLFSAFGDLDRLCGGFARIKAIKKERTRSGVDATYVGRKH